MIRNVGLKEATDSVVWEYAKTNGFLIVAKDSDFHQRSLVLGYPPKVVWAKLGNCSTKVVERFLREHDEIVRQFHADDTATFLILS